jgi:hypothetical protein
MTLTVFLLDYQRFANILHFILPKLLHDSSVSQIILSHGTYEYEWEQDPRFPRLEENEVQIFEWEGKQIIRIQDPLNEQYQCYRRWIWIDRLYKNGLLKNELLLTHDDDYMFYEGEIANMISLWNQKKGICICGSGGRNYTVPIKYRLRAVNGPCNVVVGQSILLSISSVLEACRLVEELKIPEEILFEDDIVISFLVGKGEFVHFGYFARKLALPSPNARWQRANHIFLRNRTADWMITQLVNASLVPSCPPHLRFQPTTDDTLTTSETTVTQTLSQ